MMNDLRPHAYQAVPTAVQVIKRSAQSKLEKIPFASEYERRHHEMQRRAQGWEATYEWHGSDGNRDIYIITLTELEF